MTGRVPPKPADRRGDVAASRERNSDHGPRIAGGERRLAAVIFVDLTGYTRLSESLDVEDLQQLESRFLNVMEGIVEDYGGTVTDRHGDSLIGVFGYPISHDNDVIRAAATALDMHAAMPLLTHELGQDLQLREGLTIHIGISLGEVVPLVPEADEEENEDPRVVGKSLTLAKRLSDMASPAETLISEPVYRVLLGKAECEPIGDLPLEGFSDPLPVLRLLMLNPEEPGLTQTPFVGRKYEHDLILRELDHCRRYDQRHFVTIRGEAGMGKTRLAQEVARSARTRGFADTRVAILDFGGARRRPFAETLTWGLLDLRPDCSPAVRRHASDRLLRSQDLAIEHRLFLHRLLGLSLNRVDIATLEAMDNRARLEGRRALLAQLVRMAASERPVLLIVEDMHWAEPEAIDDLVALAAAVPDVPVSFVVTWRLGESADEESWGEKTRALDPVILDLSPLTDEDALLLVMSSGSSDPVRVRSAVDLAKGNPLFLEQVVRHAEEVEAGRISGSNVPDLVMSLVQARMDRLLARDHRALQAAAVIGDRFEIEQLRYLLAAPNYDCTVLMQRRFVRSDGAEFVFAHDLVRQGVYRSILKSNCRQMHRRVADWFSDRDLVLRAEHLEKAEDPEAPDAFFHAAKHTAEDFDYDSALKLVDRSVALSQPHSGLFDQFCLKGDLLSILGRHEQSNEMFALALDHAPDENTRCRMFISQARNHNYLDQPERCEPLLSRAESIAAQEMDAKLLSDIFRVRGAIEMHRGHTEICIRHHERSFDFAKQSGATESMAQALRGLGLAHYLRGRIITAREKLEECIRFSIESGLERTAIEIMHFTAYPKYYDLDIAGAMEVGRQSRESGVRIRHPRTIMNGNRVIAYMLLEQGRWDEAEKHLTENLRVAQELQARRFEPILRVQLAKIKALAGHKDEATHEGELAFAMSRSLDEKYLGPCVLGCYATFVEDRDKQDWALRRARQILKDGSASHNYFWFYRDAIAVCLQREDWEGACRFADALEAYAAGEPLPYTRFYVTKGRTLADWGRGNRVTALRRRLQQLLRQASEAGMAPEAEMIASALGGTATATMPADG